MSIRFKFRSSVAFDSVDLGGRHSISVRDLRARIVAQKNLQICRDFDLVISDAETGKAFGDEGFEIAEGSSVVIKRVPAGSSLPSDLRCGDYASNHGFYGQKIVSSPPKDANIENFDDFGVELYPALEGPLLESDADIDMVESTPNTKANIIPRCSDTSISRRQNNEISDLNEAMSKEVTGDSCQMASENEEIKKQINLESRKEMQKLDEGIGVPSLSILNKDLPTELRCFLCNTIFKDAVMIPCCQHSFCHKCVRSALVEKAMCPKCSSTKCTVQDLLPNLSLRQAIEHFLEAQVAINVPHNMLPEYAPDGESGIHAKEVSCAISIRQKEPTCPHSPSATGNGSNQVMTESRYENKWAGGTGSHAICSDTSRFAPQEIKQMKRGWNGSAEGVKHVTCHQGGDSSSKLAQTFVETDDAKMATQKRNEFRVGARDESGILVLPSKMRKGDRNCYMCGSPDHLMRDCPVASNSHPLIQTGDSAFTSGMPAYGQAYWNEASLSHARPYANVYNTPGMMPFDPTMAQVSPFGFPSYMSSMYSSMPVPYSFMRMGGFQPSMMGEAAWPLTRTSFLDPRDGERKQKYKNPERKHDYDNISEHFYYNGPQRSHDRTRELDKNTINGSFSDEDTQRLYKKHALDKHYSSSDQRPCSRSEEEFYSADRRHDKDDHRSDSRKDQRDQRALHYEKSFSEVQYASDVSNPDRRERASYQHRSCHTKHSERRGQCASDSSRKSHHKNQKEISSDEKVAGDHRRHIVKHHALSEYGSEPHSSGELRHHHKEKGTRQNSRHSRQLVKSTDDRLDYDRWELVDGLDNDYKGEHYNHKRKRTR